jgi:hypothetical protein
MNGADETSLMDDLDWAWTKLSATDIAAVNAMTTHAAAKAVADDDDAIYLKILNMALSAYDEVTDD